MKLTSYDVIREPVITEKSVTAMAENKYAFMVHIAANKVQIKRAVEEAFSVEVADVETMGFEGKTKRVRAHIKKRVGFKKAVITSARGSSIEFFEGMQ